MEGIQVQGMPLPGQLLAKLLAPSSTHPPHPAQGIGKKRRTDTFT